MTTRNTENVEEGNWFSGNTEDKRENVAFIVSVHSTDLVTERSRQLLSAHNHQNILLFVFKALLRLSFFLSDESFEHTDMPLSGRSWL